MRWHSAILVLLICALSKWLLATDIQIQDPSLAGMPLSDAEYDHFFKTLNSPGRVSAVCFLRSMYGCQNALVQTLDLYENHGIVPEGRVCSNLAEMPSFPDFCTLTFYRCSLKKYFVKRIQCPDEISETSSTTQSTNEELENTESSFTLQETPLTNTRPTTLHTAMISPPPLISVSYTPTAATETITTAFDATVGTIPKHPSIISDMTSMEPLFDLPTSSTPVTTDSESLLELLTSLDAVIAGQSFPELFTTTLNTAEGSFSQHLMPDLPSLIHVPSTSNAMTATPVTSVSVVIEPSSEPTTPEATTPSVGSVPTHPAATVAIASSPTSPSPSPIVSVTVSATETTKPSVGSVPTHPAATVATASSSTSASPSPIVTVTLAATETTTPSVDSVPTHPAATVATASSSTSASPSPIVTVTLAATELTTPSVGSVPTNPAATVTTASSPTSASPSSIVTVTLAATETTTPSVGSIPTNPATTVATASSPTSASPSPIVTVTATEATTPSVGSIPTNPPTTVAPTSSPTSASPSPIVTVTATEATTPSVGSIPTNPPTTVAPTSSPTSASASPIVTVTVSATETTTPSVGSVPTNPSTTVAPTSSPTSASPSPVVTVTVAATETTTPSVGTVSTNPATTVATASSPTSASPSPIIIMTATATPTTSCSSSSPSPSLSPASKGSGPSTKPTSPKSPAHVLPPARVAEWPVVPISALLGQYPLQPTPVVQLLLLSPGFGPRRSKPQAIAVSSLLPFGAGPANIRQRKMMPRPPMNVPTTAKRETFLQTKSSTAARLENSSSTNLPAAAQLENVLTRLKDKRVQQLLQKMRELIAKGKALKKQQLQSTSLQLFTALNNGKQKSVASLEAKKQLQR